MAKVKKLLISEFDIVCYLIEKLNQYNIKLSTLTLELAFHSSSKFNTSAFVLILIETGNGRERLALSSRIL